MLKTLIKYKILKQNLLKVFNSRNETYTKCDTEGICHINNKSSCTKDKNCFILIKLSSLNGKKVKTTERKNFEQHNIRML